MVRLLVAAGGDVAYALRAAIEGAAREPAEDGGPYAEIIRLLLPAVKDDDGEYGGDPAARAAAAAAVELLDVDHGDLLAAIRQVMPRAIAAAEDELES